MGLSDYIIRRALLVIPTLLGVVLLIFAVVQLLPASRRALLFIDDPRFLDDIPRVIREAGLDQPVWIQFVNWLRELLQGNLGWSNTGSAPVLQAIIERVPATAEIVLLSAPIIIFTGIKLGEISAVHRDKPIDHVTRGLSIMGTSLPSFWIGIVLLAIFYRYLQWFAPGRIGNDAFIYIHNSGEWQWYTKLLLIDSLLNGQLWIFVDTIKHLILPVITLSTINIATLARVMRSSMLESLNKTYVVAARVKGLKNAEVISRHARRNALIPVITLSGLMVAGMLTGLTITETVFSFPGLGQFAAQAAISLDISTVIGYALFSGVLFIFSNLLVDILYAFLDPRIRLG